MPSFADILAISAVIIVGCALLFVAQTLIAPQLIAGTLSEADPQTCNLGKQWVLYDCKPNAVTKIGCIVPGSHGKFITRKTIAVEISPCLPQSNGDLPGTRVISFVWQEGEAGVCSSAGQKCCNYNGTCTSTVTFTCVRTDSPEGGESQCTPEYLPIHDVPHYNSRNIVPITQEVPCRSNFCS